MFTTAEDWVERLVKAGGRVRLDSVTMIPTEKSLSPEQKSIWREIQGVGNPHWQQVEAYVRSKAGPVNGGFTDYP